MRISDKHRLLFIHVQKTGGSTMEQLLDDAIADTRPRDYHPKHLTLTEILEQEPTLAGYWTVGFVRNPWARMVSWWTMIQASAQRAADGSTQDAGYFTRRPMWRAVRDCPDFDTYIDQATRYYANLRRPQVTYLTVKGGRRADYVARQETLADDVRAIFARLGLTPPDDIPRINAHGRGDYRDHYSPASRDRVADLFARDIDAFGYTF